jgi:hypothetical protein
MRGQIPFCPMFSYFGWYFDSPLPVIALLDRDGVQDGRTETVLPANLILPLGHSAFPLFPLYLNKLARCGNGFSRG